MIKIFSRGLFVVIVVVTLMGFAVVKSDAQELGESCWRITDFFYPPSLDMLLVLQVTQHGRMYSLHGYESTTASPVHGNAYMDSEGQIQFGVNIPGGYYSYNFWAPLDASTLSSGLGEMQAIYNTTVVTYAVQLNNVPCP